MVFGTIGVDMVGMSFSQLMPKLIELGLFADNGKARGGRKYVRIASAEQTTARETTNEDDVAVTNRLEVEIPKEAEPETAGRSKTVKRTPLNPRIVQKEAVSEQRTAAKFAAAVLDAVIDKLSVDARGLKVSEIETWISESLRIDKDETKAVVGAFIASKQLFVSPIKGTKYLTTSAPETKAAVELADKVRGAEELRILQLREDFGADIIAYLATL